MAVQHNPFVYGRPITREEDLADRELYSRPYMRRHGIRGPGSVDGAVRTLTDLGELEMATSGPVPTDPLFAAWVRERMGNCGSGWGILNYLVPVRIPCRLPCDA